MKKILVVITLCLFTSSLLGCASGRYKPGTYVGEGTRRNYGYETAEVAVDQNKITNIVLHRVDTQGQEVNYDDYTGAVVNGQPRPNLKQIRVDQAQQMLQQQTFDVATVTGATDSTQGWKDAVKQALDKAKR